MGSRINLPDLAFALFLVCLGAIAFWLVADLPIGSATSMGPGYVPRGLALLLIALGAIFGGRALFAARVAWPATAVRPLVLIGVSVALFAVLLRIAGLAVTSIAVVAVAGYAAYDVRVRENLLLALGLAVFSVALFVLALGLPIPIWPQR